MNLNYCHVLNLNSYLNPLGAWCLLKGHTYLNIKACMTYQRAPGTKKSWSNNRLAYSVQKMILLKLFSSAIIILRWFKKEKKKKKKKKKKNYPKPYKDKL